LNYLLDTNICIAILNNRPELTRHRVQHAVAKGHRIILSTIVVHELFYGAAKSSRMADSMAAIGNLLAEPYETLGFNIEAALAAAKIRAALEKAGTPIGYYDLLIAGQALVHDCTLATANLREFNRVEGLKTLDWTK
jgi:tRNA(fMet)-specific endonuclease VapC